MYQELEMFLENDDEDNLQRVIAMGTSVDFVIPSVSEDRPDILKSNPPMISFAAFYKAENCVNFLIQNDAIISIADKDGIFNLLISITYSFRSSWRKRFDYTYFSRDRC